MKSIILLAGFLAAMMCAISANANELGDTIVIEKAKRVTIVNDDSLLKVNVDGTESQPNYHYEATLQNVDSNYVSSSTLDNDFNFSFGGIKRNKSTYTKTSSEGRFFVGFNGATGSNDVVKTNMWQSVEIGFYVDYGIRPWLDGNRFSFGLGLDWRNWRMTDRRQFVKASDGSVSVESLPEGADPKFSRLKEMSIIVPLMYSYEKHDWGFSIGPVINFTPHANILTKYKLDGEKHRMKSIDIHQNKVTVDLMATFINPWIDVYFKYNPCNILDTGYGPRFHSISFGLIL